MSSIDSTKRLLFPEIPADIVKAKAQMRPLEGVSPHSPSIRCRGRGVLESRRATTRHHLQAGLRHEDLPPGLLALPRNLSVTEWQLRRLKPRFVTS